MSKILMTYRDMAFSNNKQEMARRLAVNCLIATMNDYVDGRAKNYEVESIVKEIEEIFEDAAALPLRIIRGAMNLPQERRLPHITRAIDMLEKTVRNESPSALY